MNINSLSLFSMLKIYFIFTRMKIVIHIFYYRAVEHKLLIAYLSRVYDSHVPLKKLLMVQLVTAFL